ncbi:Mobile element protein [Methanosarcina barkeri str. Wiesmoor]|uniref:Mobile element protein n=1 Tax=Methanosarcina barkeri str. Wiesmoor TaxID=1434109 RepID=A0A0E3QMS3_METBA|nr:Mobile element protein [Methanosarcina barkeri str. Wiesmoor]
MTFLPSKFTYGHAKDGRDDLKRFGLRMITNQYGMPLFAKVYSDNASDKETIIEAMKKLQENITFPDDVYYIADSALYSDNNIKSMREGMKWITRVPSTLNLAKDLLISDLDFKPGTGPCYSFYNRTRGRFQQTANRKNIFQHDWLWAKIFFSNSAIQFCKDK